MSAISVKKEEAIGNVTVIKKLRNYSDEPAFKKKAEKAIEFLKKKGLPKSFRIQS